MEPRANFGPDRRGFASALLQGQIHVLTGIVGVHEVPDHERYDIQSNQWTLFAGIPVGLSLIVAVVACLVPALRAGRVDPVGALSVVD